MTTLDALIAGFEEEIEDADEETFLLYAQQFESSNLGFIDPRASSLDVTVHGRDFTIHQSPSVLSSSRAGGTTGAVLWKITPLFASWISSPQNPLFRSGALTQNSTILELGCGISPLNALALAPRIARYVLTDQPYVQKFIRQNLDENQLALPKKGSKKKRSGFGDGDGGGATISFACLDWETDEVSPQLTSTDETSSFDAIISCDCVFNYSLVQPFVQSCIDACKLRRAEQQSINQDTPPRPTLCIVAQQLRNDEVFQLWLSTFSKAFRVWRIPGRELPEELRPEAGFVIHVGVLIDVE